MAENVIAKIETKRIRKGTMESEGAEHHEDLERLARVNESTQELNFHRTLVGMEASPL